MDTDSRRKIWENIFQLSQAVFRVTHLFPREEILRRHLRAKATEILYQASQSVIASEAKQSSRFDLESPKRSNLNSSLISSLHNFRGLLFSAKSCDFVNEQNFTILIKECAKIIEFLESFQGLSIDDLSLRGAVNNGKHGRELNLDDLSLRGAVATKQSHFPEVQLKAIQTIRQLADYKLQTHQPNIGFFAPNPRQQKLLDYLQKCQDEKLQLKDIAEEFKNVQPRTIRQDLKELCDGGYLTRNGHGAGSYYIFPKNNTS